MKAGKLMIVAGMGILLAGGCGGSKKKLPGKTTQDVIKERKEAWQEYAGKVELRTALVNSRAVAKGGGPTAIADSYEFETHITLEMEDGKVIVLTGEEAEKLRGKNHKKATVKVVPLGINQDFGQRNYTAVPVYLVAKIIDLEK